MSKPSTMLSDAFGTLVVRMIGIVSIFVSTMVTARLLGPAEYGTYSAATALALLLAALAPLGSERVFVRNLSNTKCPKEIGLETAIVHLCTAITATLLITGSLMAWLVNCFILDNPQWGRISLLATIMFVPLTVVFLRQWLAIPIIGSRRAMIPEQTVLPLIFTTSMLTMAAAGLKLTSASAAATYALVIVMVWIGSLQSGPIRTIYRSAWSAFPNTGLADIRRQLRNGLPFVSIGIGSLLTQSCMPLVIAATCGFEGTAYYSLAMPYAAVAAIPLGVFNLTMIPRCARWYKNGDFAEASHAIRSSATITFLLAAALSIVIWICSPILTTLLGTEYRIVCCLLPPLLLGVIVDCLTGTTIPVMQTMKMETTHARALLAFIPIQIGLVYWLGGVAGIEGAATAYLTSRCLWNVIVFVKIYQLRGLVMLPYLSVGKALSEFSPHLENETIHHRPKQCRWRDVPTTDVPLAPVRAA